MKKNKIILASSSPRRKKLLKEAGFSFNVIIPEINEEKEKEKYKKISTIVKKLSLKKAEKIKEQIDSDAIIVAADTMLYFDKKILGKPKTKEKAKELLKKLSQKTHYVYTGFCIIETKTNKIINSYCKSAITFKKLSDKQINQYVNNNPCENMAGGYNIQKNTPGEHFVEKIKGSETNIVGLPMEKINISSPQ